MNPEQGEAIAVLLVEPRPEDGGDLAKPFDAATLAARVREVLDLPPPGAESGRG